MNDWLEVKMDFMKQQVGKWPKTEYREVMFLLQVKKTLKLF